MNQYEIQNVMVSRGIFHLQTNTLPVVVMRSAFPLLPLGRYLLPVANANRWQSTGSSGQLFFTTTSRNVTIVRNGVSLVTILLLDLVYRFRENSNEQDEDPSPVVIYMKTHGHL